MNNQDLEVYAKIARKDLSFGCIVKITSTGGINKIAYLLEHYEKGYSRYFSKGAVMSVNNANRRFKSSWQITEIIGGPIVLSDLLCHLQKNPYFASGHRQDSDGDCDFEIGCCEQIVNMWNLSKPYYEDQSEECITFIRNLIKDE